MKRTDENRIVMFGVVNKYLTEHAGLFAGIPATVKTVKDFAGLYAQIRESSQVQGTPVVGVTADTDQLRAALEDETMDVADALGALAADTADEELAAKVDFTSSAMSRWSIEKVLEVGERVLALGQARQKELADYTLDPASEVAELKAAVLAYAETRSASRKSVAERSVQTAAIPALVAAATALLRTRLDRQINYFRRRDPVFFQGYRNARVILGPGQGTPDDKKMDNAGNGEAGGEQSQA